MLAPAGRETTISDAGPEGTAAGGVVVGSGGRTAGTAGRTADADGGAAEAPGRAADVVCAFGGGESARTACGVSRLGAAGGWVVARPRLLSASTRGAVPWRCDPCRDGSCRDDSCRATASGLFAAA